MIAGDIARNEDRQNRAATRKIGCLGPLVEQDEDGYYVATVPELRGCHTQAKSLDVLTKRVREAIALCLADERVGHRA